MCRKGSAGSYGDGDEEESNGSDSGGENDNTEEEVLEDDIPEEPPAEGLVLDEDNAAVVPNITAVPPVRQQKSAPEPEENGK